MQRLVLSVTFIGVTFINWLCRRYRAVHGNDLRLTHHACERMAQRNISVQELFDRDVSTVVHKGSIVTTYRTAPTGISTRRQSTRT